MTLEPIRRVRLRAALAAASAAPRKRHGQHFLLDDRVLTAIVRDAGVAPGDRVLEVGPGPGLLTRHLLAAGAHVLAIEIDPAMGVVARALIDPSLAAGLEWIEADALAGGGRLSGPMLAACEGCDLLVSNLPYGVAAPLLLGLVGLPRGPRRLVVTVQRELAARLSASPGRRDYGRLAVTVGLCARARSLRTLPPEVFWPVPRVHSVLLELVLRASRPDPDGLRALQAFLRAAFHNRRKTLMNSLSEALGLPVRQVLARLEGEENLQTLRAEALEPVKLYELATRWAGHAPGERKRP